MNEIKYYCGGRGAGGGGKAGGGGGGAPMPKSIKNLEKKLAYAKDRRRSVISHDLKVKWDKEVANLERQIKTQKAKGITTPFMRVPGQKFPA